MKSNKTYRLVTSWEDVPVIFDIPMAARIIGAKPASVKRRCQRGDFPAFKNGKLWRITKEALLKYINENGNDAMKKVQL